MVLLTMTPSIVDTLKTLDDQRSSDDTPDNTPDGDGSSEPSLAEPAIGKPISHGQIVHLWKRLNALESAAAAEAEAAEAEAAEAAAAEATEAAAAASSSYSLEQLLQGSCVYLPPPPPKPEPSEEYKALMARLRREEDARSYERMINPPPLPETFHSRFPSAARAFAEVNRPSTSADIGDDDVTYNEIHRQVMLIVNFLVSVAGVAATLWIAGRWWSVPARLFLTMGGSILVAIAEVIVYSGYMWRMGEAKQKQAAVREVKQVVKTWVVGRDDDDAGEEDEKKTVLLESKDNDSAGTVRKRNTGAMRDSAAPEL